MRRFEKLIYILTVLAMIGLFVFGIKKYFANTQNVNGQTNADIGLEHQERVFYEPEYNAKYIRNINTIEISNEEIKNKNQFVYISDLHVSCVNEEEEDEQIRESLLKRNLDFYGDKDSSIAKNTFKEIVNYTNNKNANALLLTGDIIDSPADSSVAVLRENLNNLKTDYLYTLGNHDWSFPWDYHTENAKQVERPKFEEFMDDTGVSYLEYEDLMILAINSSTDQIEEESLDKIKQVLEKQKPTIVIMHVPISTPEIAHDSLRYRNRVSATGDGGITPTEATRKSV